MQNDLLSNGRRIARLAAALTGLCCASAALAHVFPQHQEPGAGTTALSPPEVRITFDGPLEPAFSTLTVTDASGKRATTAKGAVDPSQPSTLSVALPALSPGRYSVHWAAVADDGHRTHGDYSFNVK
jgi:copper resistance protein C